MSELVCADQPEHTSYKFCKQDPLPTNPPMVTNAPEGAGSKLNLDERYEWLGVIGNGVYGKVYKALDKGSKEIVAIKRLLFDDEQGDGVPAHVIREVSLLRDFKHPNIVQLRAVHIVGLADYYLSFEYIEMDLHMVLKGYRKDNTQMGMDLVNRYSKELLNGTRGCHARRIIHRDLKPQNILIHRQDGLKICDFGLARIFGLPLKPYTHDVVTLWYRAPELLLGEPQYGPEVDVWSVGCIVAEMATGFPTFPGDSEIGTIFKIFQLLGSPTEASWPGFSALEHWKGEFPKWQSKCLKPILDERPELGEAGIDLLQNLLCLNPAARLLSRKAKMHAFFNSTCQLDHATEQNQ